MKSNVLETCYAALVRHMTDLEEALNDERIQDDEKEDLQARHEKIVEAIAEVEAERMGRTDQASKMKMRYAYCRLFVDGWICPKKGAERSLKARVYGAFTTIEYAKGYSFVREGDLLGRTCIDVVADLEAGTVLYSKDFGSKWVGIEDAIIYRYEDGEEHEELLADWWVKDSDVLSCIKEAMA